MDDAPILNLAPLMQYGFAGFAFVQLVCGVFICLKGIQVLASVRDVVQANTAAAAAVDKTLGELRTEIGSEKEEFLRRPCQMTPEALRELLRKLQPQGG